MIVAEPTRPAPPRPDTSTARRAALLLWAIAGGYWVANAVAGWLARLLVGAARWQNGEATILSCLLGIAGCAALVVWAFAHRSPLRASLLLLAWGLVATSLGWVVPGGFGLVDPGPAA